MLASAAPASGQSGPLLEPDLVTLDRGPIRLCQEAPGVTHRRDACEGTGRVMVRLSSFVANTGAGPLEYAPAGPAEDIPLDCHGDGEVDLDGDGTPDDNDVVVQQRRYGDANGNGVFNRSTDTGYTASTVGCRYYHPEHDHYHVESFAEFLLRNEATGQIERTGGKISFCVGDSAAHNSGMPGAPGSRFYSTSTCTAQRAVQGISVGWYDLYAWGLAGQQIDVTGMPAGTYCLISRADPNDLIAETNDLNNDRRVRLQIDPAAAPRNDYRNLKRQPGGCAPL